MEGRYLRLRSASMGRDVHLWCYGYYGAPVVVFPSAAGFAHEWQQQGMISVLSPLLQAGKIKLYCPESNVAEAWTRREGSLDWRMERHHAYEQFVFQDLFDFIRKDCHLENPPLTAIGCSLGAMYAANFALKDPKRFRRAICMSGRYLATELTDGESNLGVYFNSPLAYLPNLQGRGLEDIQRYTHITLICGRGAYEEGCIEETISLSQLFRKKNIPHHTDIWGKDSKHDWSWWKRQTSMYMNHYFA
ncbi:MAG: alpha/beta fold hydrolase [Myxococcota bacterium]|nr:alpha/beta fold hydrolase [Myxococcota bacterium]